MQLRVGDRFTDDRGEWEIVNHLYGTVEGGPHQHPAGAPTDGRL